MGKYKFGEFCAEKSICKNWSNAEHLINNKNLMLDEKHYIKLLPFTSGKKIATRVVLYALIELTIKNEKKFFCFTDVANYLLGDNRNNYERFKSFVYLVAKKHSENKILFDIEHNPINFNETEINHKINEKNKYLREIILNFRYFTENIYYGFRDIYLIFVSVRYMSQTTNRPAYKLNKEGLKLLEFYKKGYLF